MKKKVKRVIYPVLHRVITNNRDPYKYILLLATARSGSTLLQHILTTNPAISGFGETKTHLEDEADLEFLAGKIHYYHWRHRIPRNGDAVYLLDKIVHNEFIEPENIQILNKPFLYVIFLIREPIGSINSFMRVLKADEEHALHYYKSRLRMLTRYALGMKKKRKPLFLDFDQLVNNTDPMLRTLEGYLQLEEPLREDYEVTSLTGDFGVGDKSENIKSGSIQSTSSSPPSPNFSPEILEQATAVYEEVSGILQEHCIQIRTP